MNKRICRFLDPACQKMSGERDCIVVCGGRTFNLHSSLLVSQSKFFAKQLEEGVIREVEVGDIDSTVFGEVAQYLYDGVVGNLPQEKLAEQMVVAEKLGIEQLQDELAERLMLSLTEANVVEIAALAQRCNAKQLLEESVKLIVGNSVKMTKDEVIKYPSLVLAILEQYSIEVRVKEEEIAVKNWMKASRLINSSLEYDRDVDFVESAAAATGWMLRGIFK